MNGIIDYLSQNTAAYFLAVWEHIWISLLSVFAACCIGIPCGILCSRFRFVNLALTGLFTTLRIIPSLAVLILCIPLMGTGVKPALCALGFLALPPVLINTALAFRSIAPSVLETALGIGMGRARTFFQVKIPLALPLILTGFKTACVEVIASATLAAYIGAGGLGTIIFTGLGLMRTELLLIGGVSVAVLALLSGFLLTRLEHRVLKYQ